MTENKYDRKEQWRERIRDYRDSGLTMRAWCAARGFTFNQLKYWLRKLSSEPQNQTTTTWVTVVPTAKPSSTAATLVVRVGGASIDIHPGFDPSLLGEVVQALAVDS